MLDFKRRGPVLVGELLRSVPDIVTMQEVRRRAAGRRPPCGVTIICWKKEIEEEGARGSSRRRRRGVIGAGSACLRGRSRLAEARSSTISLYPRLATHKQPGFPCVPGHFFGA